MRWAQRVIFADASDFLLPSDSAHEFHDPHDNVHKPFHEEPVKREHVRQQTSKSATILPRLNMDSSRYRACLNCLPASYETDGLNQLVQDARSDNCREQKFATTHPECDRPTE